MRVAKSIQYTVSVGQQWICVSLHNF